MLCMLSIHFKVLLQGSKSGPGETAYFGTVKGDPNFNAKNDAAKLKAAIETKGKVELP